MRSEIEMSKNSAVDCGENTADDDGDEQLGKEITFILSWSLRY